MVKNTPLCMDSSAKSVHKGVFSATFPARAVHKGVFFTIFRKREGRDGAPSGAADRAGGLASDQAARRVWDSGATGGCAGRDPGATKPPGGAGSGGRRGGARGRAGLRFR